MAQICDILHEIAQLSLDELLGWHYQIKHFSKRSYLTERLEIWVQV